MKKYMVFGIFLGLIFMSYTALAAVKGRCYKCHAMHYSQSPFPTEWLAGDGPNNYLLAKPSSGFHCSPCVSCHSSQTSSTYRDLGDGCMVPVVFYFGASAPTEYLAGGNFWWVKDGQGGDDTKGHNVFEGEGDDYLTEAPGGKVGCGKANSCHANLHLPVEGMMGEGAILNGKYGCEGCHIQVRHHARDHPNFESGYVNTADQGWYRFLCGHNGGAPENFGVEGYEDNDWEAGHPNLPQGTGGPDSHNEYLGQEFSGSWGFSLGPTTTAFCTGCHGDFHLSQKETGSGDAWIRHPSDSVIPNTSGSEYADTGGPGHLYDPLSPVAKPTVDTPDATVSPGNDMVMCLSCHRPHGSPYPDLLRWDYAQQISGSDPGEGTLDQGCFYCHTTKDN